MAVADPKNTETKGGLAATALLFVTVTIVAAALGLAQGYVLHTQFRSAATEPKGEETVQARPPAESYLKLHRLDPIVANLKSPSDVWIRLDVGVVLDSREAPEPAILLGEISEDIVAYLRTISLPQLSGGEGLLFLKEDLKERGRIRAPRQLKDLLVLTMVVQ